MSGLKKMIEGLSKAVKFSSKMVTIAPAPAKIRSYDSLQGKTQLEIQTEQRPLVLPQVEEIHKDQELVLLDDIEKECVLGLMEYYEYLDTFTGEFVNNQGFIQKCNDLFMRVSEDRPVKKELLLEICPELYTYEILSRDSPMSLEEMYKNLGLKEEEKAKVIELEKSTEGSLVVGGLFTNSPYKLIPPIGPIPSEHKFRVGNFSIWDPEDIKVREIYRHPHYSPYEIQRRIVYIWSQVQKTYMESADTIETLEEKLGSVGAVFSYLQVKGLACSPEEQKILDGIEYIKRLMKEQYEFVNSVYEFHANHIILPFPMPDWLRDKFLVAMKDMVENKMFDDLGKAMGLPDNGANMLKEIEIREQKAYDAMVLDERDRKTVQKMLGEKGDEMLVRRNLSEKDNELIRKMNLLSDTINVVKPLEPVADFSSVYNPEEFRFKQNQNAVMAMNKEELHTENLVKVLYLNNMDPQEYNLEFWAETLNISTQRLRNIFYNFSYLVYENHQVVGKISFIDVPKKTEIFDAFQESLKREFKQADK